MEYNDDVNDGFEGCIGMVLNILKKDCNKKDKCDTKAKCSDWYTG